LAWATFVREDTCTGSLGGEEVKAIAAAAGVRPTTTVSEKDGAVHSHPSGMITYDPVIR
jgi:hypothetical protein